MPMICCQLLINSLNGSTAFKIAAYIPNMRNGVFRMFVYGEIASRYECLSDYLKAFNTMSTGTQVMLDAVQAVQVEDKSVISHIIGIKPAK